MDQQTAQSLSENTLSQGETAVPSLRQPITTSPFGRVVLYSVLSLAIGFVAGFHTPGLLTDTPVTESIVVEQRPQENLKLLEWSSSGVSPTVKERLDYNSLQFSFVTSSSTKDRLREVDTVVFNDQSGKELGRVVSKNISLQINDEGGELLLIAPVAVGNYLKENDGRTIEYAFLSKGKVYGKWNHTLGGGYFVRLDTGFCGKKGEKTLCVETNFNSEKCSLFSKASGNKKIADFERKGLSSGSLDMTVVSKNDSVYAECYTQFGGSLKSSTVDTGSLPEKTQG